MNYGVAGTAAIGAMQQTESNGFSFKGLRPWKPRWIREHLVLRNIADRSMPPRETVDLTPLVASALRNVIRQGYRTVCDDNVLYQSNIQIQGLQADLQIRFLDSDWVPPTRVRNHALRLLGSLDPETGWQARETQSAASRVFGLAAAEGLEHWVCGLQIVVDMALDDVRLEHPIERRWQRFVGEGFDAGVDAFSRRGHLFNAEIRQALRFMRQHAPLR